MPWLGTVSWLGSVGRVGNVQGGGLSLLGAGGGALVREDARLAGGGVLQLGGGPSWAASRVTPAFCKPPSYAQGETFPAYQAAFTEQPT